MTTNTRRYSRTAQETFRDADYASALEHFGKPRRRLGGEIAVWVGIVFLLFVTLGLFV